MSLKDDHFFITISSSTCEAFQDIFLLVIIMNGAVSIIPTGHDIINNRIPVSVSHICFSIIDNNNNNNKTSQCLPFPRSLLFNFSVFVICLLNQVELN